MSFKLKALIASLSMVVAMPAFAAIDRTFDNSGNSSVILFIVDRTQNVSASFDLGWNKGDFVSTNTNIVQAFANTVTGKAINFSTNADYSAAWNGFFAISGVTAANTEWALFSGDSNGNSAGARSIFAAVANPGSFTGLRNADISTMTSAVNPTIDALNSLSSHTEVANGANFTTKSSEDVESAANIANLYDGQGRLNLVGGDFTNALGSSMNTMNITTSSTDGTGFATLTSFGNSFNLASTGEFSYSVAAVPEADSMAMMLAGLGLMGFIARRRKV